MQCVYCQQDVAPETVFCPKCGLPASGEEVAAAAPPLELEEGWLPPVRNWVSQPERRVALLLLGGAAAAGAGVGILFGLLRPSAPATATNVVLQSRPGAAAPAPVNPFAAPAFPAPLPPPPAITSAPPTPAPAAPGSFAPAPEETPSVVAEALPNPLEEAVPLPAEAWPAPKPAPRRPVARQRFTEPGVVPPAHMLASNPNRKPQPQYVVVLPNLPVTPAAEISPITDNLITE